MTQLSLNTATSRRDAMLAFIREHAGETATCVPLAGDASFRRYERVVMADGTPAVLMDAPPDKEDTAPFIAIGDYLVSLGFSAPHILARDIAQGFLLLEDLGDDSYTKCLQSRPEKEPELYQVATQALVELHAVNRKQGIGVAVPAYDTDLLMREVKLFSEWFLPAVMAGDPTLAARMQEWDALWRNLLAAYPLAQDVLVLRDYHADNLMWLPEREGTARAGLLDFQDGVAGHAAYDLVSLLEDARRDVGTDTVAAMKAHYLVQSGMEAEAFEAAYALLGAQRNAKIIGIFVRLGVRDGKLHYTHYLPRVWRHFEHDLQHPLLAPVRAWVDAAIPAHWRGAISLEHRG